MDSEIWQACGGLFACGSTALIISGAFTLTFIGRSSVRRTLSGLQNFSCTRRLIAPNNSAGIAIDDIHQQVCLAWRSGPLGAKHLILRYQDIIESEIVEGGHSVTKTSRGSLMLGAMGGEALFGPLGAVVGAVGATKTTKTKVTSLDLRIVMNNLQYPVHEVKFLKRPGMRGGMFYRQAMKAASEWHGLLSAVIRRGATVPATSRS